MGGIMAGVRGLQGGFAEGFMAEVGAVRWGEVVCGECLEVVRGVPEGVLDLVYMDPNGE